MDWNCAPTGIGSLPHQRAAEAVDLIIAEMKEVPFWPQLPALGFQENMYAQFARHLPGIEIDKDNKRVTVDLDSYDPATFYTSVVEDRVEDLAYDKEGFQGFFELLSRSLPSGIKALKGQVTGPISLGLQVTDRNGKSALYDEIYGEIIRKNLNLSARWQEERLKERASRVLMFIDEPSLSLVGTPFAPIKAESVISWIDEVMEGLSCLKAVHCCGNTDWPMVLSTGLDVLSFDAYDYAFTLALYPKEVSAFLDRGGSLAWGIVPNQEGRLEMENERTLLQRFEHGVEGLVNKGLDRELVLRRSLLTPQCGLGHLEEGQSVRIFHLLHSLTKTIREKYRLEG